MNEAGKMVPQIDDRARDETDMREKERESDANESDQQRM